MYELLNKSIRFSLSCFVMIMLFSCTSESDRNSSSNKKFTPPEPAFIDEGKLLIIRELDTLIEVAIEIADNEARRQRGLMYRTAMKKTNGMLFIFDQAQPQSFWMENTYIPLDILFIGSDLKILQISPNTIPYARSAVASKKPAQYVLELNGGICKEFGIKTGDHIQFHRHE